MIHIVYNTEDYHFILIDDTDYSSTGWHKNLQSLFENITKLRASSSHWSRRKSIGKPIKDTLRLKDSLLYSLPAAIVDMPYQEVVNTYPEFFV